MKTQATSDLLESICSDIKARLERSKEQVHAEIRNYPPPIPACDVQFNQLLEKRTRVSQELTRLQALSARAPTAQANIKRLDELITTSTFIDDEAKRKIRASLRKALSTLEE